MSIRSLIVGKWVRRIHRNTPRTSLLILLHTELFSFCSTPTSYPILIYTPKFCCFRCSHVFHTKTANIIHFFACISFSLCIFISYSGLSFSGRKLFLACIYSIPHNLLTVNCRYFQSFLLVLGFFQKQRFGVLPIDKYALLCFQSKTIYRNSPLPNGRGLFCCLPVYRVGNQHFSLKYLMVRTIWLV